MKSKILIQTTILVLGLALAACRPAQKDPPVNWDHNRVDASVKALKIAPEHPLSLIGAPDLWKKTTGKAADGSRVRIAIVGTGVDYTNPDIRDALAMNLGELSEGSRNNGMDDDQNGYADDVFGYDFFSGDGLPYDWHGHDTFVAGVIAATGRNNPNVVGVAPNAELIIARYLGSDGRYGQGTGLDAVEAIGYSVQNNAKIIYFNWPQGGFDETETPLVIEALKAAGEKNVLVVTPAGNTGNQDIPAFLKEIAKLPNVIVVAGLDGNGHIQAASNSGKFLASVAAPAVGGYSYLPGQVVSQDIRTTSVAAGYVAGAAALISTLPGRASVEKIREALLSTAVTRRLPEPIDVLSDGALFLGSL
jgi:hypothetical protein